MKPSHRLTHLRSPGLHVPWEVLVAAMVVIGVNCQEVGSQSQEPSHGHAVRCSPQPRRNARAASIL
jgi:hypothetical protein